MVARGVAFRDGTLQQPGQRVPTNFILEIARAIPARSSCKDLAQRPQADLYSLTRYPIHPICQGDVPRKGPGTAADAGKLLTALGHLSEASISVSGRQVPPAGRHLLDPQLRSGAR